MITIQADVLTTKRQGEIAPDVFLDPLGFILSEHQKQTCICRALERLVDDLSKDTSARLAASVLAYLTEDLPSHRIDEEEVLFSMLESRFPKDEGVGGILSQLRREHVRDQTIVEKLLDDLTTLQCNVALFTPLNFIVNALMFSETQRRHISWEDNVLVPLARRVFTDADLVDLGRAMAERQGVGYPA